MGTLDVHVGTLSQRARGLRASSMRDLLEPWVTCHSVQNEDCPQVPAWSMMVLDGLLGFLEFSGPF